MTTTYNEILNKMKTAFYEKCGENVDLMGDIGARFQTVASELFSLYCYGDFILKQAFVQTASGQYLDYHAALRDMKRKSPSNACGELMFSIPEVSQDNIVIPEGTICSMAGYPYIQYKTTEEALIKAGELSATAGASAIEAGSAYNAKRGSITVMVNPPSGVAAVTNIEEFTGGCNNETDESLRKRILSSYSVPPTGVSVESIRECILKIDDVLDCLVMNYDGLFMPVYLKTKKESLDAQLTDDIENALMIAKITGCETYLCLAEPKNFDLNIDITLAADYSTGTEQKIREIVLNYTDSLRIGETLNLSRISYALCAADGIEYCEISSRDAADNLISCDYASYLKLNNLTVNCYE